MSKTYLVALISCALFSFLGATTQADIVAELTALQSRHTELSALVKTKRSQLKTSVQNISQSHITNMQARHEAGINAIKALYAQKKSHLDELEKKHLERVQNGYAQTVRDRNQALEKEIAEITETSDLASITATLTDVTHILGLESGIRDTETEHALFTELLQENPEPTYENPAQQPLDISENVKILEDHKAALSEAEKNLADVITEENSLRARAAELGVDLPAREDSGVINKFNTQ